MLVRLFNSVLENQFVVQDVEILTPYLENDFEDHKLWVSDLCVRDARGRQYSLEMQTTNTEALHSQLVYYLASIYSEQLGEAESYRRLAPAIST